MSVRYTLSPRAQRDLDSIWDFTQAEWGTDQADAYLSELRHHIEMISRNPAIGTACPEIRAGYRKHVAGSHVIFYRVTRVAIDITRILHERMDFGRHI